MPTTSENERIASLVNGLTIGTMNNVLTPLIERAGAAGVVVRGEAFYNGE